MTSNLERITSAQNPRLKDARRLRQSRARLEHGRLLIDGRRELRRALDAGVTIEAAYLTETWRERAEVVTLVDALGTAGVSCVELTAVLFDKLCFGDRCDGVVAVARAPERTLAQLQLSASPLLVIVEGVEKPGNVGAIIRTADAAGVDAVIVADGRTDLYNPNAIRASLGTIFSLPVCAADTRVVIHWLQSRCLTPYIARLQDSVDYAQLDYQGPTAFVLGSEAHGVSSAWQREAFTGVRLPMAGVADSLNVSTAAAVLLYEARRQRNVGLVDGID